MITSIMWRTFMARYPAWPSWLFSIHKVFPHFSKNSAMSHFYNSKQNINPWKVKKGAVTYDNPWITVFHDEVTTPGGSDGIYGSVHFKNHAIGIVPVDDEGCTWLVGQYRYALKRWSWEIPEGGCPVGTNPLDTAKRELKEEAGLVAKQWRLINECDLSNCVSDEIGFIYLAEDIIIGEAKPDESEELELLHLPFSQAYAMVMNGEIRDVITIIGIMKVSILHPELIR